MLFVYIVIIIGMVWSIRFKTISPHNYRKILRFFYIAVGLIVVLAAMEMAQIILTGGSSLMEIISKYLIYSNSYVLNFIKFGGKRTTALYFEPAFFALALISIWLSIKQFGIKTPQDRCYDSCRNRSVRVVLRGNDVYPVLPAGVGVPVPEQRGD